MELDQSRHRTSGGFTLLELLVALAVGTSVLVFVLRLLDFTQAVAVVETDLSSLQQTQRVTHNTLADAVRMAGRGGLPMELAMDVADNVAEDFEVAGNQTVDGTDVLRLRGIFDGLLLVDSSIDANFEYDEIAKVGTVVVDTLLPTGIARQSIATIERAVEASQPAPLLIVSAQNNDTFAVVQLQSDSEVSAHDVNGDGSIESWEKRADLRFSTDPARGLHNAAYMALSSEPGAWPETLTNVALAGILQEFRYYVREPTEHGDGNQPKLSRAEVFPNTDTVVGDAANGRVDLADAVADLQIARGFDTDLDFRLDEDRHNPDKDEWLGNHPDDPFPAVLGFPTPQQYEDSGFPLALMTHVAVSTMIRSNRRHPRYVAPALPRFENRLYQESEAPTGDELLDRRFRRRLHRTIIDVRNL